MVRSAIISTAAEATPGGTAGEFVEVGGCHFFQVIAEFLGQLRHVPEHITQLEFDRLTGFRIENTVAIPHHFLDLVRHLTGFAAEAKGRIRGIAADIRVSGCAPSRDLIGIELHGDRGETPGW